MRKCPACAFYNPDSSEKCVKCGTGLTIKPETLRQPRHIPGANLFAKLSGPLVRWGRRVRRALSVPLPLYLPHRFPLVAAFLGLVPGLGQLYNYQPKKLIWFVPPFVLFFALTWNYITTPYWSNVWIACTISVMLVSFWDALMTAARINGQYFTFRNQLAVLTYPFFLLGAIGFICSVMAWLQWPVFTQFHINENYMEPVFKKGDAICGEGISYLFRNPRPGDVVHYDPPPYKVEIPNDLRSTIYLVNAQNGWERVMAVGGETLECRDGVYYVDGKKLSKSYYPLLTSGGVYKSFKITCPPNQYIVLISCLASDDGIINNLRAQVGTGGAANKIPEFVSGVIVTGWEAACCVPKTEKTSAGGTKTVIYDRACFIYFPSERRRFFQAEGPRFEQDAVTPSQK